jgi:hypothetical protein
MMGVSQTGQDCFVSVRRIRSESGISRMQERSHSGEFRRFGRRTKTRLFIEIVFKDVENES